MNQAQGQHQRLSLLAESLQEQQPSAFGPLSLKRLYRLGERVGERGRFKLPYFSVNNGCYGKLIFSALPCLTASATSVSMASRLLAVICLLRSFRADICPAISLRCFDRS